MKGFLCVFFSLSRLYFFFFRGLREVMPVCSFNLTSMRLCCVFLDSFFFPFHLRFLKMVFWRLEMRWVCVPRVLVVNHLVSLSGLHCMMWI